MKLQKKSWKLDKSGVQKWQTFQLKKVCNWVKVTYFCTYYCFVVEKKKGKQKEPEEDDVEEEQDEATVDESAVEETVATEDIGKKRNYRLFPLQLNDD